MAAGTPLAVPDAGRLVITHSGVLEETLSAVFSAAESAWDLYGVLELRKDRSKRRMVRHGVQQTLAQRKEARV